MEQMTDSRNRAHNVIPKANTTIPKTMTTTPAPATKVNP